MPEDRLRRWYWIMDEKTLTPVLRGGQLNNREHHQFFIEDMSPDMQANIQAVFDKHAKNPPVVEYKVIKLGKNREKIEITGITSERE
ncbi:hypothetical protein HY639_01260 [Candidatus Woesearchaeota archaeon]|nr:hypothetical protein [Candidatus Woesearchaeota archaeon]